MKNYTPEQVKALLKEHKIKWSVFENLIMGQACPLVDDVVCYYQHDVDSIIRAKSNK